MKQKDILLIVVVLLLVGIVKLFRGGEEIIDRKEDSGRSFYEHVDSPHSFSFPPEDYSGIRRIVIDNPAGSLTVLPAEGEAVTLQSTLIVFHPSEKTAGELQNRLKINRDPEPDGGLRISATEAGVESVGRFRLDHTLWVPDGVFIDARTRHGDVEMAHVSADLKLRHAFGSLDISEWTGNLDLEAENCKLELVNVSGEQRIGARGCEITIQNADRLELVPRRCQVNLSGIRERVVISKALLNRISIDNAANVRILGSSDQIGLDTVSGTTSIQDEFEDIELINVTGDVSLESKRSRMTLKNVNVGTLFARCSYRDAEFSQISFQSARIELHQSDLLLGLKEIGIGLDIDGVHSDVILNLPESLTYSADVAAKMGEIVYASDASFSETRERGLHRLSREIPGAVKLRVVTSYGDITIRKTESQ